MVGGNSARAALYGACPVTVGEAGRYDADLLLVSVDAFAGLVPRATPIMVFDAPDDPAARAALLDAGAADVLGHDPDPIEVRARVRAILRRGAPVGCADLAIDFGERRAWRAGRPIALHPREFMLLAYLARHRDRPVMRAALYAAVWQRDFDPGTNVVAVAVSRLRAKVDAGIGAGRQRLIHTVAGGYMLSAIAAG